MAGPRSAPRAHLELVRGDRVLDLGPIAATVACDGALVDDLLRLDLATRRFGWHLRLRDPDPQLRELFDLVGLADQVLA